MLTNVPLHAHGPQQMEVIQILSDSESFRLGFSSIQIHSDSGIQIGSFFRHSDSDSDGAQWRSLAIRFKLIHSNL